MLFSLQKQVLISIHRGRFSNCFEQGAYSLYIVTLILTFAGVLHNAYCSKFCLFPDSYRSKENVMNGTNM
jgi:hypothetical protein